jgi:L-ascorbate metabolism protein UlaG (beta-lactamase superfamily)
MNRTARLMLPMFVVTLASAWLAGCGTPQPTERLGGEPTVTVRPARVPTETPIPPMPVPRPTDTAIRTASPTPQGYAPVIVNLEDLMISDGERFPRLKLEGCVTDEDHAADEIDWQISGNKELDVRLVGSNLVVLLPLPDWTGSETLRFEACDPDGLCDSQKVAFTVRAENDAPVVSVSGQIIMPGETFAPIALDDFVHDEDHADGALTWNVSGSVDLGTSVEDRVATIALPFAEWQGKETIRFEACDTEGACDSEDATFRVMERTDTPIEVTFIGNAGFMITIGDKKILIDALVERPAIPGEVAVPLETAQGPFEDVDLILATHSHSDHFSADKVHSHLENNPEAVFVSGQDAVSMVNALGAVRDRTLPIRLRQRAGERTQLAVNGIGLECIHLSHGGDILNLGFVITAEGRRVFHPGDMDPATVSVAELQRHGLPDKQIDVSFVAHFMLITEGDHAHITEGIQADYVIAMHYRFTIPPPDYDLMASHFPDAIVFHESMESWVMPD